MTDVYAWWRKALEWASDCRELTRDQMAALGVAENDPQAGFYRTRAYKEGPFLPVAIWPNEAGGFHCLRGGQATEADQVWSHACRNPITEATYHAAVKGEQWPNEPPAVTHNAPVSSDPHEQLTHEFAAEKELAEAFLKKPITTQDQADQAAIWSKRLAAIAKKATDHHKVEKQPSLDEGRRIDDKWRGLKEEPTELSKRLKRALDVFLNERAREEAERQRRAREEAERIRREAEEEARRLAEADVGESAEEIKARVENAERLKRDAEEAEREAIARNASAGRTGAKVSLRTYVSARIVDYDKVLLAFKDHPEMKALVEQLANRAIKTGVEIAGVERVEEKRAA